LLDRYAERRFTAVFDTGGVPVDINLRFRGMLCNCEPKFVDIFTHTRILILAETGGGKSVVARAAVQQFIRAQERVPIFAELNEYRGDLAALITKAAPTAVLDLNSSVDGKLLLRTYSFSKPMPKRHKSWWPLFHI